MLYDCADKSIGKVNSPAIRMWYPEATDYSRPRHVTQGIEKQSLFSKAIDDGPKPLPHQDFDECVAEKIGSPLASRH